MSESTELSKEVLSPRLISIRYDRLPFDYIMHIGNSGDVVPVIDYLRKSSSLDYKEYGWVLSLTHSNGLIGLSKLSEGTLNSTLISRQQILQVALLTNAAAMIVIHNHPSGDIKPSDADLTLTKSLKESLKLFEITLLDHFIITTESYLSMADKGMII